MVLTLTHSHFLTLTLSLSLSLTHSHTLSLSHTHTHSHSWWQKYMVQRLGEIWETMNPLPAQARPSLIASRVDD